MKVRSLLKDTWEICAICNERGDDPIQQMGLTADEDAILLAFLGHIAANGTRVLASNRNHEVNDVPKIIQLTVGSNVGRLLYFYDRDRVIIICSAFRKRGGKSGQTPREIVKAAAKSFHAYFKAKSDDEVDWIE